MELLRLALGVAGVTLALLWVFSLAAGRPLILLRLFGPLVVYVSVFAAVEVRSLHPAVATAVALGVALLAALLPANHVGRGRAIDDARVLSLASFLSEGPGEGKAARLDEAAAELRNVILADAAGIIEDVSARRWRGWFTLAAVGVSSAAAVAVGLFPQWVLVVAVPVVGYATWRGALEWHRAQYLRATAPDVQAALAVGDIDPSDFASTSELP